jgi:UDP-3-O-[3-hydroxymyristoyl] glucosamine N-acyltransferase
MPDRRFYSVSGPFTLAELAEVAEAKLLQAESGTRLVRDVAPLDTATPDDVSFLDNPRYADAFRQSRAGACVVHPDRAGGAPAGMAMLVTTTPYRGYARIAQAFYPDPAPAGRPTARDAIDATARIGDGTEIGLGAVIGARAEIGKSCRIGAGVVIGPGVVIGDHARVGPGASLAYCLVGAHVRIFAGARIGEDGFGFAPDPRGHVKVPQLGRVIIGDDVEVGANSTIDRGSGPDTVIGDGCRIDNLVQIGHNVRLGRGCVIVAQTGISGSTVLEDHVVIGGQGGLAGHLRIGAGAQIGAQAGVLRDVAPRTSVGGTPAMPLRQWLRQSAILARLARKRSD